MPRCGCASGAQIQIQGEDPVLVVGGGPATATEVSLSHDGYEGCQAVTACVCESTGQGLTCLPGEESITLQARLSTDAGNAIRFGSDGGLMATDAGLPGEQCSQKTVDSLAALPAGQMVVGGFWGAGLVNPFNAPRAAEYALNHNIDILHLRTAATADGVAVCPELDMNLWVETDNIQARLSTRFMTSEQVQRITSFAGGEDSPGILMSSTYVPPAERDAGWWGMYAERYKVPTLASFLDRVAGKSVVLAGTVPADAADEERIISAVVAAGNKVCAQDWLMIGIFYTSSAPAVIAAGYTPIMLAHINHVQYGSTVLPWPVADLETAGVQWVVIDRNHADSVATTYSTAGLHVLRRYVDRHVDRAHTETMDVRGYLSFDPVYCSGLDRQEYRTTQDPWRHGQHGLGALSHQTGRGLIGGDINGMRFSGILGRQARGYVVRTQAGLVIPEGYGQGRGRPSVSAGWACPLPNASEYVIEWEMRADQTPPNSQFLGKMGVLFGSADDQDTYDWAPGATYPAWVPHYYRAYVRYNGAIGIGVWRADGSFWYLRGTDESTSSTGMEVDGPNLVVNQFNAYRLTVTPTEIQFRRTRADGTTQTVTATNSEYRGPYFYVEKEEEIDGSANPFRCTFRSMIVNSVPGA